MKTFFLILVITSAVNFVVLLLKGEKRQSELCSNVVQLPKIYFWVGSICLIGFIGLFLAVLIFPNDSAEIWIYILFVFFILLSMSLIIAYCNCKIFLRDDEFTYKTVFANKYIFRYTDVDKLTISQNIISLKVSGKTFFVDPNALGIDNFIVKIHQLNNKV